MAATATAPSYTPEQYEKTKNTYGSIRQSADIKVVDQGRNIAQEIASAESIFKRIKRTVDDDGQYADGELAPSASAIETARRLLESAAIPEAIHPTIAVYYGELDITWQAHGKLVRLIVFSDSRAPRVYFHVDSEAVLTRGHSNEATQESFNERIQWLLTES